MVRIALGLILTYLAFSNCLIKEIFKLSKYSQEEYIEMLKESEIKSIFKMTPNEEEETTYEISDTQYRPVVQMHGMGDFATNPMGMEPMRAELAKRLNTYVTNVALGSNFLFDSLSEFLMLMNKEVETFANKVKNDPKLVGGFNAVGFSQGNLIIRG